MPLLPRDRAARQDHHAHEEAGRVARRGRDAAPPSRRDARARAHYRFMAIYPWPKNSGKVARLLMNMMLLKDGFPPVVIHSIERQRYYDVLRAESAGLVPLIFESLENGVETGRFRFFAELEEASASRSARRKRSTSTTPRIFSPRPARHTFPGNFFFRRTIKSTDPCVDRVFIRSSPDDAAQLNASIDFDQRLLPFDVEGSKAHARMLAQQGILTAADAEAIRARARPGGRRVATREVDTRPQLEDVHMNVEVRLTEIVGDAARGCIPRAAATTRSRPICGCTRGRRRRSCRRRWRRYSGRWWRRRGRNSIR